MVLPPRVAPSAIAARIASMSKPQWVQKFASSAATTERNIKGATLSTSTHARDTSPKRRDSDHIVWVSGGLTMRYRPTARSGRMIATSAIRKSQRRRNARGRALGVAAFPLRVLLVLRVVFFLTAMGLV